MQTITICTDAGHRLFYKKGEKPSLETIEKSLSAWACYIRTPSKVIRASGVIHQMMKGSSQAELAAIANAFHILSRDYDLSKYKVILYSDSTYALRNHRDGSIKPHTVKSFVETYNKYVRSHIDAAGEYEARHVKAHLPQNKWDTSSARHFMQNWCDEEVHRMLKLYRKKAFKVNKSACVSDKISA